MAPPALGRETNRRLGSSTSTTSSSLASPPAPPSPPPKEACVGIWCCASRPAAAAAAAAERACSCSAGVPLTCSRSYTVSSRCRRPPGPQQGPSLHIKRIS